MRTIRAIFTGEKKENPTGRSYSFNTELNVKVGDLIASNDYKGKYLQVVKIEDDVYSHFTFKTGELKKEMEPGCGVIKTLADAIIVEETEEVEKVYNGF